MKVLEEISIEVGTSTANSGTIKIEVPKQIDKTKEIKIMIDDEIHGVRIAIKKKIGSNHFYIHHIDTQKSPELLSPSQQTDNYEIQNFD